ncbi:MAG: hypothetical protein IPN17_04815 [Deltaproteobacteria bacterium]|nr:hypothetical protein [Deltaproteobacteria bacterium]
MEDRVALKLAEAPRPSTPTNSTGWQRASTPRDEARARALRADNTAERVLLYEPAPAAADELQGGRAIDRFHKRVSRARQQLLALLGGER